MSMAVGCIVTGLQIRMLHSARRRFSRPDGVGTDLSRRGEGVQHPQRLSLRLGGLHRLQTNEGA